VTLDPATVETNIVIFDVQDAPAFAAALAEREVAMSHFGPTRMRAVTHLDVDDAGIDRALAAAAQALQ
jgi:threonine aldolase